MSQDETEQEGAQKKPSNQNLAERRLTLYAYLGHCIRVSHEKMSSKGNSDGAKQSWGRLMVSAITAYGGLIKDAQLEDIESRLTKLEEQAKERSKKG